jgi:preprotein translocase subunit YajC
MKLIPDAMAQTEPAQTGATATPATTPAPAATPATATPAATSAPATPAANGKTTATAAAAGAANPTPDQPSMGDLFSQLAPVLVIVGIVYLIVLRPQQRKQREEQNQLRNVRRGDVVVVSGLIGKISKVVDENEIELEIAPNTRIRALKAGISEVRARGEPVKETPAKS